MGTAFFALIIFLAKVMPPPEFRRAEGHFLLRWTRRFLLASLCGLITVLALEPTLLQTPREQVSVAGFDFALANLLAYANDQTQMDDEITIVTAIVAGGFLLVQIVIFVICLSRISQVKNEEVKAGLKLKLLDNEENLFDLGLYVGLGGTVLSLILLLVLQVKQDALIGAYTSTLFGILFVAPSRYSSSGLGTTFWFSRPTRRGMNRSLLLVVCDFLLLSILALARFDVPKDAEWVKGDKKLVDKEVVARISDGESYDDVVAELEATNETLLENLSSDKDDLVKQKEDLEEQIAQRRRELAEKEEQIASRDATIAQNEADIQTAKEESEKLEAQRREIEKKREELLQNNAASKKELELLAKNLADAKKRSDELAALKEQKERETESMKVQLAATQEKAKAEEQRAAEAKALLLEEKKRSDALVASTTKIDEKIDNLNQGLQGVGQDLKQVGEGLAGVGDKIASVTDEVSSVRQDVTSVREDVTKVVQEVQGVRETVSDVSEEVAGVGSRVETIQQDVAETAAEQQENFRKLSERQTKSVNEIYSKYQDNKIKLSFSFSYLGGFLGSERRKTSAWTRSSWLTVPSLIPLCTPRKALSGCTRRPANLSPFPVRSQARSSRLRSKLRRSHLWTIRESSSFPSTSTRST